MRVSVLDRRGMTLVEVMVSVALFSVLSMGLMMAFAEHAKKLVRAQNESQLSEQLQLFTNAIESYLMNTTQFIACNCGNGCVYSDQNAPDCNANPATCSNPPGGSNTLLRFEYEDSVNPAQAVGTNANCVLGGLGGTLAAAVAPDNYTPRGCKRRMDLVYTPPVPAGGGGPAQPGQLQLVWEDLASGTPATPPLVAAQLPGVYAVQCGQISMDTANASSNPSATALPSPENFRIRIRMKTRATNLPTPPTDPAYEGWHPSEAGFWQGTHRTISTDINFRNLDVQGVQFGKSVSYQGCTPNGSQATAGNCCSGYADATGTCLDASQCLPRGQAAPIFSICCSHKTMNGNCL